MIAALHVESRGVYAGLPDVRTCGTATAMREPTPDPGQWSRTSHAPDGDGLEAATRHSSRYSSWETTRDASPRPWTRCDGTAV